ncbi:unnamed protein product [Symbiodinium sp. CCMP2592]|nr:unnamed protein product [Symbiodinium sp. CCMP2592]
MSLQNVMIVMTKSDHIPTAHPAGWTERCSLSQCRRPPPSGRTYVQPAPRTDRALRALERLRRAVAEFPREARREVLEAMAPTTRLALLAFMERLERSKAPLTVAVPGGESSQRPRPWPARLAKAKARLRSAEREAHRPWRPRAARIARTARTATARSDRQGQGGVYRKQGGWMAKLCLIPYFYVSSRCFQSPQQAASMLKVLRRARDLTAATATATSSCYRSELLKQALVDACCQEGLELQDLAPSFTAYVDAKGIVGCAVSSRSSTCLEEALDHRSLLLAGRAKGWSHFREAWLHVLQATVQRRPSRAWGRARSKPLKKAHAEVFVDKARRSFELQMEATAVAVCRKRLARAVQKVDAVLKESHKKRSL